MSGEFRALFVIGAVFQIRLRILRCDGWRKLTQRSFHGLQAYQRLVAAANAQDQQALAARADLLLIAAHRVVIGAHGG